MKILVSGLGGHMGAEVAKLCQAGCRGAVLTAGVDYQNAGSVTAVPCAPDFASACADVDCVVDFSHHACTGDLLAFGVKNRLPLVIATTGQTEEERAAIEEAAKQIPIFFAANFSLGIALLIELAKKAAAVMPDAEIEIIEKHHDRKLDAPSGTALAIARALQTVRPEAEIVCGRSGMAKRSKTEIGISAVRMGNIAGEHEVLIGTDNQTITLKHETHDRALFAEGALAAAAFLCGKPTGLYDMQDLLAD
jgi:4-hydroxy-tetrahydrodipicolinate reductase